MIVPCSFSEEEQGSVLVEVSISCEADFCTGVLFGAEAVPQLQKVRHELRKISINFFEKCFFIINTPFYYAA